MTPERLGEKMRGEKLPYPLLHIPVNELRDGQGINQCFLVRQKTQRTTRAGDPYLEILLADRTASIPARAWADVTHRCAGQFDEGEFVMVQGRAETYRNNLQIIVESIRRLSPEAPNTEQLPGFDPALLVPTSERDGDEMWAELMELVDTIEPETLQLLTRNLLEKYREPFSEFPAAVSRHHAYIGGLLEHTLEVAQAISSYALANPGLCMHHGLATAGAILHDIGKVLELENPIAATYSFDGQLIGHLLLGRDMVQNAATEIEWNDPRIPKLLEHILIAHHGELEYAAAMVPKTAEALAVYHFDNLSAKLNMICMHVKQDGDPGQFTDWERTLDRKLFKGLDQPQR